VRPLVALDIEHSTPIFDPYRWSQLSITRDMEVRSFGWAQQAKLRTPLIALTPGDADLLIGALTEQATEKRQYPLTTQDEARLGRKRSVRTLDREVIVEVPDEDVHDTTSHDEPPDEEFRQSHRVQAAVARIGAEMGFRIWVPRNDRQKVQEQIPDALRSAFLDGLPLNYDDTTLKTIEQIDVIWLRNRSMARAFEVEHTTAIYSGILRMADLLALQPNMDIRLHIVAPDEKREKVLREIRRPVFSLLDRGPLYENCSYLGYSDIQEIAEMKHLNHMSDSIVEEYEEFAQDV
jgi:hypothetical protein